MFTERNDDDNGIRSFTALDIENNFIRLPLVLFGRLANGSIVTVVSSFYRNMSGLLPGNLPSGMG